MSDKLAFLDEPQGSKETPAPTPEPVATETPPPAQEQPPQPSPTPEPQPSVETEWTKAMALDEREKRQALQKQFEEAQRKIEELSKPPATPIDPLTDPEGFRRDFDAKVETAKQDILFDTTHRFAVKTYGADVVKAAEAALGEECKTNPAFFQTVARQPDPYDFVVKWHKRQLSLAKLGDDDPDTWAQKQFETWVKEKGYVLPERGPDGKFVAASPAPATPTPLPKPSLAAAPAATGNAPKTPVGDGVAFNAAFRE